MIAPGMASQLSAQASSHVRCKPYSINVPAPGLLSSALLYYQGREPPHWPVLVRESSIATAFSVTEFDTCSWRMLTTAIALVALSLKV